MKAILLPLGDQVPIWLLLLGLLVRLTTPEPTAFIEKISLTLFPS